jgi:cytochrome P450
MLHHHEEYWSQPHDFNPDRFKEEIHPYSYLPFGAGPRQCIGNNFAIMELKVLLTFLLANRKVKLMTGFPGFDYSLTLRPQNEVRIKSV